MKKSFLKIFSLIIAIVTMLCLFGFVGKKSSDESDGGAKAELLTVNEIDDNEAAPKEVYTITNKFCYILSDLFTRSADSMEAWVKLPVNSLGGTIASNTMTKKSSSLYDWLEWRVDPIGRVGFAWGGYFDYTFDNESVIDGKWHHVAVIRDTSKDMFLLYIDGELSDTIRVRVPDVVTRLELSIGAGFERNESKSPFEGQISQITFYNGAISQDRIKEDMTEKLISDDYNGQLIGNWYLGEEWTERIVKDSSNSDVVANLSTYDKYVGDATGDFEYDYMIIEGPDIQTCVRYKFGDYINMMGWLSENGRDMKVLYANFLGDLSDNGPVEKFYRDASVGMSFLDGNVNYNFVPGNHDYDDNSKTRKHDFLDKYFPYEKHSQMPGFGGVYEEGSMTNSYYTYSACGVDYLVINLEYSPRLSVLRWAGRLCEEYPNHRVMINTHWYVGYVRQLDTKENEDFSTQQMFDNLVKLYPNIFMVFSGHLGSDNVLMRKDTGIYGNTIFSFLLDLQVSKHDDTGIGEDALFLMKFNEKNKQICCCYYSPSNGGVFGLQNQFIIPFPDGMNT